MKWDPSLPRPVSHDVRLGGVQVAFRINYEAGRAGEQESNHQFDNFKHVPLYF